MGFSLCEKFLEGGWPCSPGSSCLEWPALDALREKKYPDALEILPLDVGCDASVRAAAEGDRGALRPHIDLLVSCAGISGGDDPEKTRAIYNVNVVGAVRMVETFLPLGCRPA